MESDWLEHPDMLYRQIFNRVYRSRKRSTEIVILGLSEIHSGLWLIKTAVYSFSNDDEFKTHYLLKTIIKTDSNRHVLVPYQDYTFSRLLKREFGNITYYYHPWVDPSLEEMNDMQIFNEEMSQFFNLEVLNFDYILMEHPVDVAGVMGIDFNPTNFVPEQYGGLADIYNDVIYAGNGSAYYPHEAVHLYVHTLFDGLCHKWIDEGIATFLGGSSGQTLDEHLCDLASYMEENPDYFQGDLLSLDQNPKEKLSVDLRYSIGGLICKLVADKMGNKALLSFLASGTTDEEFYQNVENYLGVDRTNLTPYLSKKLTDFCH